MAQARRISHTLAHNAAQVLVVLVIFVIIMVAYLAGRSHGGPLPGHITTHGAASATQHHGAHAHGAAPAAAPQPLGYACAMRCVPPLPEEGRCPICGMIMQPVFDDDASAGAYSTRSPRRLVMTPEAVALARVQTSRVERRDVARDVILYGTMRVDPRRRAHMAANVRARIDRFFVDVVGATVEQGQDMVLVYSPELLAVQEELLEAVRMATGAEASGRPSAFPQLRARVPSALESPRQRLLLAGLTAAQVRAIEDAGRAFEQVTLTSPVAGTVLERHGDEGEYVEEGGLLFTIADLSLLWLELEAFESDLPWIEVGAPVSFHTPSHPGVTFEAEVSFIEPLLRPETRTVRVRVEVPNPDGRLKPGMFATATVAGRLRAGWSASAPGSQPPLVIPATAPLLTGRRAVVYVMDETADRPTFEGREVVLGPRAGNTFPVLDGLSEGELVVTRGAFKIDSALQILTRPSMLSLPAGDVNDAGTAPTSAPAPPVDIKPDPEITRLLAAEVIPAYLDLATALADDSFERAQAAWQRSVPALEAALAAGAGRDPRMATWLEAARAGASAADIAKSRVVFEVASIAAIDIIRTHGNATAHDLHIAHCPMTFDWKGSDWLQLSEDIHNPYFGDEMLMCGYVKETLHAMAKPGAM